MDNIIFTCTLYIINRVFWPRAGPSLQTQEPSLQFCWRQVFHCKVRNQGCNFTRDLLSAVASRCFPHPTLSLASEKIPGALMWRWGEWIWLIGPSGLHQKLTARVKYQFYQGFWPDQWSGNPNHPSPPTIINLKITLISLFT